MNKEILNRWLELMYMPEEDLKKIKSSRKGIQFNLHKISNDIDWCRMTNIEISKVTNIGDQIIEHFRNNNNLPVSPCGTVAKQLKQEFWKTFDWENFTNTQIAEKFHLYNPVWVSTMRRRYAPNTIRKQKHKWKALVQNTALGGYITLNNQIEVNCLRQAGMFCSPRRKIRENRIKGKNKIRCQVLLKD